MSDNRRFAQVQPFNFAGSGPIIGATSIVLSSFNDIDGNPLSMSDFGTKGFGTCEPGSSDKEEQISFTGVVQNANGSCTLTGVKNVGFLYPYTETSGLAKSHAGGTIFVISNTSGFYDSFANKEDDETIDGHWTFITATRPSLSVDVDTAVLTDLVDFGQLMRTAIAGAVDASTIVKGIVQIAIGTELASGTSIGSTGAHVVPDGGSFTNTSVGVGDVNKIPVLGAAGALAHGFIDSAGTWNTVQSFTADNCQITTDPNSGNDAVRFSFLTTAVAASTKTGTSGEALAIGDALYLKASDGKLYKTDADADESTFSFAGINQTTAAGADISIQFVTAGGVATGLSGLVAGSFYYLSGTAGALATTPGARYAKVGQAMSTTTLRVIEPKFVAKGTVTINNTGNFVVTTGFYPAVVEIRAGDDAIMGRISGISIGDDSNTCVTLVPGVGISGNAGYDNSLAWKVYDDNTGVRNSGTVSAKSVTGFTLNSATHAGEDAVIQYIAYSE